MTPTTKRNKKGQFAKKEENPDCAPASKGYVKCIARRIFAESKHVHKSPQPFLGFAVGIATMNIAAIAIVWFANASHEGLAWCVVATMFWISAEVVVAGMGACMSSPEIDSSRTGNLIWDNQYLDPAFHAYTSPTPVCEKRKECE